MNASMGSWRKAIPQVTDGRRSVERGQALQHASLDLLERLVTLYEAREKPEKASEYRELWIAAGGVVSRPSSG